MARLTAFSFGYEGWGPHTQILIDAFDKVEAARGFGPPIIVDVRIRREVRAVGFRGNALGELIGDRYVWMRGLGNRCILTGEDRIEIADPGAADSLLELALKAHEQGRRILFYCSCGPVDGCHRQAVGDLLLLAARKANVDLEVIEWPGGDPATLEIPTSRQILRQVARGRAWLPLDRPALSLFGTPWYSMATLTAEGESLSVLTGPAAFGPDGWRMPMLGLADADSPRPEVLRDEEGLEGKSSRSYGSDRFPEVSVAQQVHPYCVYHIRHSQTLAEIAATEGGRGTLEEKGDWRRVAAAHDEARLLGESMFIVFDNADEFIGVNWVGQLNEVVIRDAGEGHYHGTLSISGLRQIPELHRFSLSHLRLKSTGKPVAPGYLYGCLLCHTPDALKYSQDLKS